jgi:hypothetical protein
MESMMPKFETLEIVSEGKKRLLALEKKGTYLFHGTQHEVDVFEPRQAKIGNKDGKMENDGEPAISSTPSAEIAIFRSLTNPDEFTRAKYRPAVTDFNGGSPLMTQNALDYAKTIIGRVYVFDKNLFEHYRGSEWRSRNPVAPIEFIEVTARDLPKKISIIEYEAYNKERQ